MLNALAVVTTTVVGLMVGVEFAVAAAALLVVSVVMSIAVLVPINNRSITWTADHHPADWREQQQRWDRLHYLRVAIIIAAFVLALVAATAS